MPALTPSRPSGRASLPHNPGPTHTKPVSGKRRLMLQTKLARQRALLLANAPLSRLAGREAEAQPDPLDQAAEGLEQELAIQARIRTLEQLHRIERALRLIRTQEYGRCRLCRQEIPFKRLAVKPDTIYCVPCLTRLEEE
ncbi:MAG: TraR/DksA C4-type zinc finger protein [Nitrospira sp.]|nr:TraR/DksA C4-type zinc finger protein [Nitrospira sp.]